MEGLYYDSNGKLQRYIKVSGRAYSPTSLFCYTICVTAHAFPFISALSSSQSMGCEGSKNGSHKDSPSFLTQTFVFIIEVF